MKRIWMVVKKLLRLFALISSMAIKSRTIRKKINRKEQINRDLVECLYNTDVIGIRRLKAERKEIDQELSRIAKKYQDKLMLIKS